MTDRTGHGNDGTYGFDGSVAAQSAVPGLVPGEGAVHSVGAFLGVAPLVSDPFAGSFTIGFWFDIQNTLPFGPGYTALIGEVGYPSGSNTQTVRVEGDFGSSGHFELQRNAVSAPFATADQYLIASFPYPPGQHFVVWTYNIATDLATVYFDGGAVGSAASTIGFHATATATDTVILFGGSTAFPTTYDEVFITQTVVNSSDVSGLYTAGVAGYPAWPAALTALPLFAWWPLGDGARGWYIGQIGMG